MSDERVELVVVGYGVEEGTTSASVVGRRTMRVLSGCIFGGWKGKGLFFMGGVLVG